MVMERYEFLSVVGEGAYGKVMKCRHRESGQIVAIKKFLETEEDRVTRKMALREIRVLKKLRHDNLVNLLEVFRKKKRFYLVFEYMSHTLLHELEEQAGGLGEERSRRHLYQIIRAIDFCHENNIVHRDVKPENLLISTNGVLKLCDFGFARFVAPSNEPYTDYVATRWYRAPELLVGDPKYGRAVDIWAIGCILLEMLTGDPLFAGDSDMDQLHRIICLLGNLSERLIDIAIKNNNLGYFNLSVLSVPGKDFESMLDAPEVSTFESLKRKYPGYHRNTIAIAADCLRLDPIHRLTSSQLLEHKYFHCDRFAARFMVEFQQLVNIENQNNALLQKGSCLGSVEPGKVLYGLRKPSHGGPTQWKYGFDEIQNPPRFSNIQATKQVETDQVESISATPISFKVRESSCVPLQLDSLEKISVPFKKDVMPRTQMIRTINNHLVVDQNFAIPCNRHQPRRYVCEDDFTLPNIPGANVVKKKKQDSKINQPIQGGTSAEDICECLMQSLSSLPAVNSTHENSKSDESCLSGFR